MAKPNTARPIGPQTAGEKMPAAQGNPRPKAEGAGLVPNKQSVGIHGSVQKTQQNTPQNRSRAAGEQRVQPMTGNRTVEKNLSSPRAVVSAGHGAGQDRTGKNVSTSGAQQYSAASQKNRSVQSSRGGGNRQESAYPLGQSKNYSQNTPPMRGQNISASHAARFKKSMGMDYTKITDISSIQKQTGSGISGPIKPKTPRFTKQKPEKDYGGEGANTIASVIKAVVYMVFVVVVSIFLSITIIRVGNDVFAFVKNDVAVEVHIPEYATLTDVVDVLYENDIISYPSVFKLYAQIKHDDGKFVAGAYTVTPMLSYEDLLDAFKEKPKTGISEITIPEGYTTDEIIDLMVSYGIGTREGYVDAIQNYDFDYWFIDELEASGISEDRIYRLDGYLFPDTYQFYNSSSEVTVLNKLLKRFSQIFTEEHREQCKKMGYTVDQIVTLASIIEKEAGSAAEFNLVSSVFHNRLNLPSVYPRLESDATIVYAIQHETGERPKLTSTDYETPYNTYLYKGLPPGPIANPSASAMLAAFVPTETEYYYFISDGVRTYFSKNADEHAAYIEALRNGEKITQN